MTPGPQIIADPYPFTIRGRQAHRIASSREHTFEDASVDCTEASKSATPRSSEPEKASVTRLLPANASGRRKTATFMSIFRE
jgi:hypothetical protein